MFRKAAYVVPPPEDIDTSIVYAFSYNPQDQPTFDKFYNLKLNTLKDWSEQQEKTFKSLKYSDVNVITEISKQGRFHYHGYIMIHSIVKFYVSELKKLALHGTYCIKEITDKGEWEKYLIKQEKFMKRYCEEHQMKYNINTYDEV